MGFFTRTPKGPLPPDIVPMMQRFGRYEIDPINSSEDGHAVFLATQQPLFAAASADSAGFIRALADVCIPSNGWATYGAERTVVNLIGTDPPGPDWPRLLDHSIAFLRANYVPPIRVPPYAWQHFVNSGGSANTWITLREPPARGLTSITEFRDGEARQLLKLDKESDANVLLIRREGAEYVVIIDARYSDEDPTRSQWEWKRSSDLYDLYLDIAWSHQTWDWAHAELEPFFPAPKALI